MTTPRRTPTGESSHREPTIVSENRYGKFSILHEFLDSADPVIRALMNRILITKAESHYQSKSIRYEGYSDLFDKVSPVAEAPEYTIKISVSTVAEHIPLKQHSKWIEEHCTNINAAKEGKVFSARSAIKNYYYRGNPRRSSQIESQYVVYSIEKALQTDYITGRSHLPLSKSISNCPSPPF